MITRHWNAEHAGCGALIVGLKRQLEQIGAGDLLRVVARSEGAPADLPSWCRVTGHELVAADHPVYILRKKTD